MTYTQTFSLALRRALFLACSLTLGASIGAAQDSASAGFTYTTFTVPGATTLAAESINDAGTTSGYYIDSSGDATSFLRASSGTIATYQNPLDTSTPTFTEGGQINKNGLVAGEYFNTLANTYEGYIYKSSTKTFSSYQVPGQPAATTTSLNGLNTSGNLCGFVIPPPYSLVSAFIETSGSVNIFSINDSATSAFYALNDAGVAVGYYLDSAGVYHGWMRTASGTITPINVPGASTISGTAPCLTSQVSGTVVLSINNAGYASGHSWGKAYNEHGFLMTPAGKFMQIDVPGAYQTSGGGLNDKVALVGLRR